MASLAHIPKSQQCFVVTLEPGVRQWRGWLMYQNIQRKLKHTIVGRYIDGWMDGWLDGGVDGWMDAWMDGWMDE